ncbi:MAG: hypothetical protein ABSB11_05460 [Sedimentisphaerales bacterium]|jgi:hypothetical protein
MKKNKKFSVTWNEYHECFATVEAETEEEAEEKWCDNQYIEFNDDCQSIDNVEICEEEDDKETAAGELKPDSGQCSSECKSAENDKSNNTLSDSGEGKPTSPPCSQELKGGG